MPCELSVYFEANLIYNPHFFNVMKQAFIV